MIEAVESDLPETDSDGDGGRSMDTQVSLHTTWFTRRSIIKRALIFEKILQLFSFIRALLFIDRQCYFIQETLEQTLTSNCKKKFPGLFSQIVGSNATEASAVVRC